MNFFSFTLLYENYIKSPFRVFPDLESLMKCLSYQPYYYIKNGIHPILGNNETGHVILDFKNFYKEKFLTKQEVIDKLVDIEKTIERGELMVKERKVCSGDIIFTSRDRANLIIDEINYMRYLYKDIDEINDLCKNGKLLIIEEE